jgi:CHASE3 domain sensor protein
MTPKERADSLVEAQGDELSRYQRMFLAQDIEKEITEAIAAAVNDTIEAIAKRLERNLHTSAAAIVRQMKEAPHDP